MLPDPQTSNPVVAGSTPAGRTTPDAVHRSAPDARRTAARYVRISVDGKSVYLHRVVMAQKLGRALAWDDVVHHIDGNRRNNDPVNLALTNHSAHASYHCKKPPLFISCRGCGKSFDVRGGWLKQQFCSRRCAWDAKTCGVRTATKTCAQCDGTFLPKATSWPDWKRVRFCSVRCAATYRWTNRQGIGSPKIARAIAEEIRRLRANGAAARDLARRFNLDKSTIYNIVTGKHWSHVA